MAIAFAASRPFVASVIVGATSIGQLSSNLAAARLKLPADLLHAIDDVHLRYPNPAP
jgi:aryl-alcohol dehydrogenase-like predicted oxidoreductase